MKRGSIQAMYVQIPIFPRSQELYLTIILTHMQFLQEEEEEEEEENVTISEQLASASLDELQSLEDDGLEDDSELQRYREQRLQQLKESKAKNRWGQVVEISRVDWVSEVTECSRSCWILVLLYQDSVPHCALVEEAFISLAGKFKAVKFIKIRSTQAIENWPDKNLPTVFAYNEGELKHQALTIKALGGDSMRAAHLEWWMAQHGIVETELDEDPTITGRPIVQRISGRHTEYGSDEDFDDREDRTNF